MNDDLIPDGTTPALDDLTGLVSGVPAPPQAEPASIFDLYPRGSDIEVLGALRFLIDVEGIPAATLEARAGLDAGTVDAILSATVEPSNDVVRHLCRSQGVSRWMFFLFGSIKYGADLGLPELQWLIAERRRLRAENPGQFPVELVAEATRLFFKIGDKYYS